MTLMSRTRTPASPRRPIDHQRLLFSTCETQYRIVVGCFAGLTEQAWVPAAFRWARIIRVRGREAVLRRVRLATPDLLVLPTVDARGIATAWLVRSCLAVDV